MEILTCKNVKHGLKVVRGPGWKYRQQDGDSIYGVVTSFSRHGGTCSVMWVDENEEAVRVNGYHLAIDESDNSRADLQLYIEDPLEREIEENGEQLSIIGKDLLETWNNAIELCIDKTIDSASKESLISDLSRLIKEVY